VAQVFGTYSEQETMHHLIPKLHGRLLLLAGQAAES
jgi:hypothetical protein